MAEKQRPQKDIVSIAARILSGDKTATQKDARRMAGRLLDDQKNDPQPNRTRPKSPRGGSTGSGRRSH
jgi:hypothetical protein